MTVKEATTNATEINPVFKAPVLAPIEVTNINKLTAIKSCKINIESANLAPGCFVSLLSKLNFATIAVEVANIINPMITEKKTEKPNNCIKINPAMPRHTKSINARRNALIPVETNPFRLNSSPR
ncbi:Uncharacterised protein [uncultured archaeon]|nr:Uncharacterised protein [uncultured archaeon]